MTKTNHHSHFIFFCTPLSPPASSPHYPCLPSTPSLFSFLLPPSFPYLPRSIKDKNSIHLTCLSSGLSDDSSSTCRRYQAAEIVATRTYHLLSEEQLKTTLDRGYNELRKRFENRKEDCWISLCVRALSHLTHKCLCMRRYASKRSIESYS